MKLVLVGTFAISVTILLAQMLSGTQAAAQKNAIGMEFMKISSGEFMMGCSMGDTSCKDDEKPQHRVRITKAFEMGRTEVTQVQWKAVMNANESVFVGDNNPVENVTRAEAIDFANRLTMRSDGYRYRLPTEAEWEYAARAGTTGAAYGPLEEIAWFGKNSDDGSHPVGGKKPNAWGLYDMLGNVREWTADTYLATYYATSPEEDPPGPPANTGLAPPGRGTPGVALPIMRGGGWPNPEVFLRASDRYHYFGPTLRVSDVGFRLVRQPAVP
jgi:formylglycine-generating enzyme required for sulfatase activity